MGEIRFIPTKTLSEYERDIILRTLVYYKGNRTRSAWSLGISLRCIRMKVGAYRDQGFDVPLPPKPKFYYRNAKKLYRRWQISDEAIMKNICISGGTIKDVALQTGFSLSKIESEAKLRGYEFGNTSNQRVAGA